MCAALILVLQVVRQVGKGRLDYSLIASRRCDLDTFVQRGGIRLALAQYRELAAFSQFASDLDEATRRQLERGQRTMELMKQKQFAPMSVEEMALSIYAVNSGFMDKVEIKKISDFEAALQSFAKTNYKSLMDGIAAKPELSKDVEASLKKLCEEFVATGTY